jgi:hypothetical protein
MARGVADLIDAGGPGEWASYLAIAANEQRGHVGHLQTLDKIRTAVGVDRDEPEDGVVASPLQHLSEKPFDPPRSARGRREEEDQTRLLFPRGRRGLGVSA